MHIPFFSVLSAHLSDRVVGTDCTAVSSRPSSPEIHRRFRYCVVPIFLLSLFLITRMINLSG